MRLREALSRDGQPIRFYLNFSAESQAVVVPRPGTDLLAGTPVAAGRRLTLGPWGLAVIRE